MILTFCGLISFAQISLAVETRLRSGESVNLQANTQATVTCEGGSPTIKCVEYCLSRAIGFYDGKCVSYGADYCGVSPKCVPNCVARNPQDGRCAKYEKDFCASSTD